MAIILKEIGFCPWILQGGWRDYRKIVRNGVTLMEDPERFDPLDDCKIILVSGTTGSGKSLLLETLEKAGEQVIHLERLAKHKGSTYKRCSDPALYLVAAKVFAIMIHFVILFSKQGKLRLQKWYEAKEAKEKTICRELTSAILLRKPKMCNFIEHKDLQIVYKRYASLFFCFAVDRTDNELNVLEVIHRFRWMIEFETRSDSFCKVCGSARQILWIGL